MIRGHKPAGHIVTYDAAGKKIERELRQCSHCQFTWVYTPGSGAKRGFCMKCMGLLCGRAECFGGCAPFHDVARSHDKAYQFDNSAGIYVRK